ncbi:MAG TPA: glycoside hydrolase family 3 N-terminal domain-containing protein [Cytophagaceae bacterium]|nr:glycoside hydrolase family 3 N-terminal domain-containing protein [Cytophagaceae bacterium]
MRPYIFLLIFTFLVACRSTKTVTSKTEEKPKPPVAKDSAKVKEPVGIKMAKDSIDLDFKIGQMILVGIADRKAISDTDKIKTELAEGKIGGIILFEKNISPENSKETLKKLISDLQANAKYFPLFMSIDEEGGKVHRLKEKYGFIKMPAPAYLGGLKNTDSTFYYTKKLAALMADLGINVNFAPDVDIALNPANPVIAKLGRSYSANPKTVSMHAIAAIKAHHVYGVKTALKHFPGHGSSTTDSHLGITDVTNLWKESELIPYKDIIRSGQIDAIMTAHIINCKLDTSCLPATLSQTIVTGLLRQSLGFEGVVFSDDMQMYAISKNYGRENAIRLSILAGVDVVVFGNNVSPTDKITATEIHAIIKKMVVNGEIPESRIDESYNRIVKLKQEKFN